MAGQRAAPGVTSTAVLQPRRSDLSNRILGLCVDRDGHLYFTQDGRHGVYKFHRQWGKCSPMAILSGSAEAAGHADGDAADARFRGPAGLCISPVDPDTLLVMDEGSVRAVDLVTGAARTLAPSSAGVRPRRLDTCASDGQHHVWIIDYDTGWVNHRLLRLDMRSLELQPVLTGEGCNIDGVMCADSAGNAICTKWGKPQLWRVRPDGTSALLAGTAEAGYRDGPAAEAQFGGELCAAAAGDGSFIVADRENCRLRLVSPDGTVSTLAGREQRGVVDGPPAEAQYNHLEDNILSPSGDLLVLDTDDDADRLLLRTVPAGLLPLPNLAGPVPPVHPLVAMCGGLLQSGLLADAVIRVVAVGDGAAQQQGAGQPVAQGAGAVRQSGLAEAARVVDGGGADEASSLQPGSADPSSSSSNSNRTGAAAFVDIPCHRNILATASPYFKAMFAGPLAQQQAAATAATVSSGTAGRKRKAAGGVPVSCTGIGEPPRAAASSSTSPSVAVVSCDGGRCQRGRRVCGAALHVHCRRRPGWRDCRYRPGLHLAQQWGLDGLLEACQAYVVEQLLGPGNAAEWLVCAHLRQYGAIRAAALRAVVEHIAAVQADEAQTALLVEAHPRLLLEALILSRGVGRQP